MPASKRFTLSTLLPDLKVSDIKGMRSLLAKFWGRICLDYVGMFYNLSLPMDRRVPGQVPPWQGLIWF